jgi:hypothetical protein
VVARGEAEISAHQISEILPVKGVTLVGLLTRPAFKPKLAAAGLDYRE